MRLLFLFCLLVFAGCTTVPESSSDTGIADFNYFSSLYWDSVQSGDVKKVATFSPILYSMDEISRAWFVAEVLQKANYDTGQELAKVVNRLAYCSFYHENIEIYMEDVTFKAGEQTFQRRYIYVFDSKYWYVGLANKETLRYFAKPNPRVGAPKKKLTPPKCISEILS